MAIFLIGTIYWISQPVCFIVTKLMTYLLSVLRGNYERFSKVCWYRSGVGFVVVQ